MTQDNQRLAALIGSRICHDLISPVGAIQNGVELLAMERQAGPELALIEDSVNNASARIRFLRIAFGLAGAGQPMSPQEICGTLSDIGRAGRIRHDWIPVETCTRRETQEVFLAMMCLESAMPRGGTISVATGGQGWTVSGPADPDRPDPALWRMLASNAVGVADVVPAQVQFAFLSGQLADRGVAALVVTAGEGITIRLPA
ncbi:hypothetical protein OB2597_02877 [Pseudooceanicola batsensis HTCC2597]|uniref:Histidine phosphotransferase ChpT C-terminal domain-containing protein n=1 Tax=Pseudooceanicola batsensis (strain ATCC BAA-863 / DSM 15984 / KCTC 12145 / HTCC2597) TaxID=252305 RepID=A3TXG9_PSEBH|nr:histidine phosphotransferase family protein [Pseudooceanicola batsensis]EAQ03529.1 hypothetical protein OB2597_02877 [Pseudooceanicola batsensis HTCC2597]